MKRTLRPPDTSSHPPNPRPRSELDVTTSTSQSTPPTSLSPGSRPQLSRLNQSSPDEILSPDSARSRGAGIDASNSADISRAAKVQSDVNRRDTSTREGEVAEEGSMAGLRLDPKEKGKARPADVERISQELFTRVLEAQSHPRKPGSNSPKGFGERRISPIQEEGGTTPTISPSVEASFASPVHTTSTESTESAKTIRGSLPPTPAYRPPHTPGYFPYVPTPGKTWPVSQHQPFTGLSPTPNAAQPTEAYTPREKTYSMTSTPAASAATFMPEGSQFGFEDPRWPTPNMYDLVLRLNSETGLEAWWSSVVAIMQEYFGAERISLAVPSNPQDIENLPWGQKATYSRFGSMEPGDAQALDENTKAEAARPRGTDVASAKESTPAAMLAEGETQKLSVRPKLESRHSFAGHEQHRKEPLPHQNLANVGLPSSPARPSGPLRTVSHAPHVTTPLRQVVATSFDGSSPPPARRMPPRESTFSDPDFSSISGVEPSAPLKSVFTGFRALDTEVDPLIDSAGVTRVLEKASMVTLTRDYFSASAKGTSPEDHPQPSNDYASRTSSEKKSSQSKSQGPLQRYEEYEQNPASSWTQSPAPSPAVQSDTSDNPFFVGVNVDEETFNPTASPGDYSRYDNVEAIGVDLASTLTHIPLIHPVWSHTLPPLQSDSENEHPSSQYKSKERKAPIAILSVLAPIVPFPQNLTRTLKYLGPHLATSFLTAQQFTEMQARLSDSRRLPNLSLGPGGLGNLMDVDVDVDEAAYSAAGSMTSPSDYSVRTHSPAGSLAGTPYFDAATAEIGFHSVGGTPAPTMEKVEGYFDAKRKPPSHAKPIANLNISHNPSGDRPAGDRERDALQQRTSMSQREQSPPRTAAPILQGKRTRHIPASDRRSRTMLHSYGATNPATPTPETPGPGASQEHHHRSSSTSDPPDMPDLSPSLRKLVLDTLPVQVFTAEPESGMITWANAVLMAYRGHDGQQILSDPWRGIHPEDRPNYLATWEKSLRTGQHLQQKVRIQRFDRQYRWFYVRAVPLKDKRQNIKHWLGTNMDIHEQHLAEANSARQQETAASEAKYRALANSSPQIVFAVTKSKGLTFCNTQWQSYSGQTEEQAKMLGFLDYVHPEDLTKCRLPEFEDDGNTAKNVPTTMPLGPERLDSFGSSSTSSESDGKTVTSPDITPPSQNKLSKLASAGILKISRDIEGRPSYSTEVRLRSRDNTYRWHLVRILLAESASQNDNEEEIWYGTCTDINDHKLLEQTLKETMDAKSRFLSNMSHEIRTPLNGITGMVNFLIDSDLTEEQMEHVNIIRNSTEGLRDLINDILDLSKVEAGMITLTYDWLHVRTLIEEVNDLTSAMAVGKGLELNYIVEDDVPAMLKGDRFRIRQVLLNVIGNAIKFTERGEVFVHCQINQDDKNGLKDNEIMLRFDVTDTGAGFTKKDAEYLFKRFSQIDGTGTRQQGGTGLGLAISMQLVELHGGKMSAESEPGKGSTFTFIVKFTVPSEGDVPPKEAMPPGMHPITIAKPAAPPGAEEQVRSPTTTTSDPEPLKVSNFKKPATILDSPNHKHMVKSPTSNVSSPDKSSPSVSSASSIPSVRTGFTSVRSERSSASSFVSEPAIPKGSPITLSPPPTGRSSRSASMDDSVSRGSNDSADTLKGPTSPKKGAVPLDRPPMFSILVCCPLLHSREAIVHHIKVTVPEKVPTNITDEASLLECQRMIGQENPAIFTHVILNLPRPDEVVAFLDQILLSEAHNPTCIVIVTDLTQRREIIEMCPKYDLVKLEKAKRVFFTFKPVKPSKFAVIFDPRREREMSMDWNQGSAQQVAVTQKMVFEELRKRLLGKGLRVLMVEDNSTNQAVLLRYMAKIKIEHKLVNDGVLCMEEIKSKPHGYYSIVLCDLEMPNKDGFQTCAEIRQWEKENGYRNLPIIALSANVVGSVQNRCAQAGFNSYCSKPFNFHELAANLLTYLDPDDPQKPHEFMKPRSKSKP